uniref:Uncharacterized protein n=1 Tax=Magallana gigas TaxID=29159 RepID=K1Q7V8_MAGGI
MNVYKLLGGMCDSESLQTYTLQACYGNGFEDFLSPTCPSGSTIYVYDVYTYSKRKDRNCPTIADQTNRNITYCCNYVNETEDCGKRYYGTAAPYEHEHYSRCSGRQTCSPGVQASWNSTDDVCDSAIFMERSNYMKMSYNCLPDSGLVSISNTSLTAQSIYLSSEGYPLEMPSCDSTSGSACTVSSSGVSTIRITGFDLQFSERSGECKQRLLITDGSLISDVACDDVNNFARSVLYTSQSTRIELRLDNADTSTGGKFWIHLEDLAEQITIECQHRSPEVSCNETFTIISPGTVTTGTTTSRTTLIPSPTAAGASSSDDVITTRISGTSPTTARYASISSIVTTSNVTTGTQSNLNTTISYSKSQRTNDRQDSGDICTYGYICLVQYSTGIQSNKYSFYLCCKI